MRNLKRALSLALAAIMLIGMMVVSASATGLDDFSDKDKVVNKDAVSMLTTLGVINGKEDGSYFDPTGNVTRAEMAKMIATVLNQGADVDGLYVGMNTGLTDVKGHWAESYINYCYSLGIIAGRGNGKFDPAATVTGNEAAKMLLGVLGYSAEKSGLVGNDWAINTNVLANQNGLYKKLSNLNANTLLTRDNAAQMIYNALDADMVELNAAGNYTTSQYSYT
ncbi:S-layer homology domain-containing protein, partial [Bacteroides ovatus]